MKIKAKKERKKQASLNTQKYPQENNPLSPLEKLPTYLPNHITLVYLPPLT